MQAYTIINCAGLALEALSQFIHHYQERFPDAKLMAPGFYLYHPAIEGGKNAFCAQDVVSGQVLAFAPLFPAPILDSSVEDPHHIWTIPLVDPFLPDSQSLRDALVDRVLQAARMIAEGFPPGRAVRLASDLMASQQPEIEHLLGRGFEHYDGMYVMQRELTGALPIQPLQSGMELRTWKIETDAERRGYLDAFNRCFPESPRTLESYSYLFDSPQWQNGAALSAFDTGGRLAASVLVYPDESGNYGITDDVFVLPEWRGQGIAKALLAEALHYLAALGISQARLEVKRSNQPAIALYESAGFCKVNEELFLGYIL